MRIERWLETEAQKIIEQTLGVNAPGICKKSQDPSLGDYQLNGALGLAKILKKNPKEVAEIIATSMRSVEGVQSAEVAGPGFINLRLSQTFLARGLGNALSDSRLGIPQTPFPETIVIDYSGPNIAKQMHVGHLRSTIIGAALVNLNKTIGHHVLGDNHLGDWGTQFGLLIAGLKLFGDEAKLNDSDSAIALAELEHIYKRSSQKAEEDPAHKDVARKELAKLQKKDPTSMATWQRFVDITKKEINQIYDRLGVTFDLWLGESAYHDALEGTMVALKQKNICREDQGAQCIFFSEHESAPPSLKKLKEPMIVQKKDGAFLYSTTDLATIAYRQHELKANKAVYVVDQRQALHFEQVFTVASWLGYTVKGTHVGFGTMLGADGKPLKTRDASGKVFTLKSLLDEAEERAEARIREGIAEGRINLTEEELKHVKTRVGIGAVKYADLRQNRVSDYQFDWDKLIAFQGNAGPYLQYAAARIPAIFRKARLNMNEYSNADRINIAAPEERALAMVLLSYPDVFWQAAETAQPHLLTDLLYDVAKTFSAFYEACPMLKADEQTKTDRLKLSVLTRKILEHGLNTLGIEALEKM